MLLVVLFLLLDVPNDFPQTGLANGERSIAYLSVKLCQSFGENSFTQPDDVRLISLTSDAIYLHGEGAGNGRQTRSGHDYAESVGQFQPGVCFETLGMACVFV